MAEDLLYEVGDTTAWLTLNRPQARNALTFERYERIAEICGSMALGGPVKVLVIIGAGNRAFAAGTDRPQYGAFAGADDVIAYEERMDRVFGAVERCPLPTIAAIAGACTGGGAGLAAACDIRIATADLRFGFPIARTLGNCLSVANLARMVALVGAGRVTDLLFTARLIGAEDALAAGLISEVVADHDALITRTTALADTLAGHAPLTLAATKEGLRRLRIHGADADDRDIVTRTYLSADFREGLEAFLAKRKPNWTGK
jgi:enoyl-CoA hydratase/carnithine racemase